MHRKIVINIFLVLILIFNGTTAFAGDVPESLMFGNQQALFIGKLTKIDSNSFTILPSTVMMGSIPQKEIVIEKFDRYYGTTDKPKVGDFLVAVLIDDNKVDETWIFKTTSADYKKLKLKSEKYSMVQRYQEYINEGKYFEAQKKLNEKSKLQIAKPEPKEVNKSFLHVFIPDICR
ncbi:MAG: hypothetical protein M0Z31_08460 [Clostridia bacterium]|nr:hypothetical protein [Clostridia bacterium]